MPPPQAVAGPKVKSRTWTAWDQPAAFPGQAPAQHVTLLPSSGHSQNRRARGVPVGGRTQERGNDPGPFSTCNGDKVGLTGMLEGSDTLILGKSVESIKLHVITRCEQVQTLVPNQRRLSKMSRIQQRLMSRYPVCGSDGITYPSGCQLRAASLRAESRGEKAITQVSKGTCEQGPSIVTPPKDIWNVSGAQVYLSCEVIGIPTPVLVWNKVKRGHYGVQRTELLPGDRDNLAIQTRGGPEKHEVTGWVLVSPLSKEDAGEYECHASNSQGQASASAKITVVDALHEIPVKKGEGAEL
nr:insulin-like growth factor-binding protein 7 [Vicugna pacos]